MEEKGEAIYREDWFKEVSNLLISSYLAMKNTSVNFKSVHIYFKRRSNKKIEISIDATLGERNFEKVLPLKEDI